MGISRFFTTPCTITTPSSDPDDASTDDEGVPTVPADTVETMCHLQPYRDGATDQGDIVLGRDDVRRARRIWLPAGTEIRYTSTVTVGNDRFTVAGDPDSWNVGSANDHIAAILVRVVTPATSAGASA